MRRKFKRLTAFLLSAAMVFPFFGEYPSGTFDFDWGFDWSVSAEETTPDFSGAKVLTAVDGALYINADSVSTIPAGNYKLESDITTDIYVYTEGSINIDLNGYTWDMSGKYLSLNGNVTLSLYDTSVNKTGKITSSFAQTIDFRGSGSTFNLYSGTVENTSDNVNAQGVSCLYGSSNLYGGKIKSNAYAVFYYLGQNITINIDGTVLECGNGHAQIKTTLTSNGEPCAVIDVSDYTGGVLTVDAKITKARKIKFFTGIQSAQDAEKYTVNVSFNDYDDFFKEKEEYEEDGGNKYVYVSVPSFTTQPAEENDYTVAFNHPDATLQWCEVTVYDSDTYSEAYDNLYKVNAGDTLIVSLSECSDDFNVDFDCIYNEEPLFMFLDSSRKTASVTFDSACSVNVEFNPSSYGTGEYKIEHVRCTELEGETDVQLSKTECETTYRCKATVGEKVYYSDEVTIEQKHNCTCTATSDNVITKECDICGKSGTLTITAEGGVYDGTTAYGATVEKTGILENEDVPVNYYQGDTLIGTDAPVQAGTYTAKITYGDVTASVIYMISTTPTAEMFNYSAPANLTYDGTAKSADVVVKDGITGVGEITVKYYQNGTEVTPINAGEYTVKIDVAEGDIYAAAADIEVGTFEITKANTVITWNDQTLASTGEEAELTAPTLTFIGNDNPEVELTYSYKAQGDAEYTNGLPTACGIYDVKVKVNVSETDNYNAVEDTMVLTITCIDVNDDEYCDNCGVIYNGIGAHLAGYTVSLNGSIGVNFHMDLTQDVLDDNEAYMLFTLPNGTTQKVMVSDAKESAVIEGNTYYIFTCNVAAKEMTDTIQAQLITSDGSKTQVYEYSVREYAETILSGIYDDETKELVKAMLHYGAYSQEWFDYNTTNLANEGLDPLDLSGANDWDLFDPIITNNDKVGSFTSAYLTLESDTAINLKFKLADGVSFEDLTFVVEDTIGNVVPVTTVTTGNVCLITLTGIKASDLDTMYDFSVTDKEGKESTISYSAMSYARAVANSDMDQKLKNVTAALRIFNLRADDKFEC